MTTYTYKAKKIIAVFFLIPALFCANLDITGAAKNEGQGIHYIPVKNKNIPDYPGRDIGLYRPEIGPNHNDGKSIEKKSDEPWLTRNAFIYYFNSVIFILAVSIMSAYIILAILSFFEIRKYKRTNGFINYDVLLSCSLSPDISIIAPAFNESKTIIHNINSLLCLRYSNYEVIIVNDGSTDDTMEKIIRHFELIPFDVPLYKELIPTKKIRMIYTSRKQSLSNLFVIDKKNGGKSDALNAGINFSKKSYIVCMDVDSLLIKDSLLKLVKPVMEEVNKRVIAVGGVVRIVNGCDIKRGHIEEVSTSDILLSNIQIIEYLRAFLLGRMAWSHLNSLVLISGAIGLFDKEIVIKAGGYSTKTVGEDMELVVRMRKYMTQTKQKYLIKYVPDPLCWTESPEKVSILIKQRSRWIRGTMETLYWHKDMFLNPKYGKFGLIGLPYWFIFEYLYIWVEFIGILITVYFIVSGIISWKFFFFLALFVYSFAVFFSIIALLTDEVSYSHYTKKKHIKSLIKAAFLEPFYFHPLVLYAGIKGNFQKLFGLNNWGKMKRKGFDDKENS